MSATTAHTSSLSDHLKTISYHIFITPITTFVWIVLQCFLFQISLINHLLITPLLISLNILIYIVFIKIPIVMPLKYLLELDGGVVGDGGDVDEFWWLFNQIKLFSLESLHFMIASMIIGLIIGVLMGGNLLMINLIVNEKNIQNLSKQSEHQLHKKVGKRYKGVHKRQKRSGQKYYSGGSGASGISAQASSLFSNLLNQVVIPDKLPIPASPSNRSSSVASIPLSPTDTSIVFGDNSRGTAIATGVDSLSLNDDAMTNMNLDLESTLRKIRERRSKSNKETTNGAGKPGDGTRMLYEDDDGYNYTSYNNNSNSNSEGSTNTNVPIGEAEATSATNEDSSNVTDTNDEELGQEDVSEEDKLFSVRRGEEDYDDNKNYTLDTTMSKIEEEEEDEGGEDVEGGSGIGGPESFDQENHDDEIPIRGDIPHDPQLSRKK